ncbi:sodium:proton antiporter [Bosea sp. Root670]|uniref:monovalent cation/H+ antiporter complex subunit F n=1 Tax=unclassified Bosea (in: a-proteobacteria) TaxID=2653178 RepID=UPI0007160775|nr:MULTISPECIES: monovalent cation/H+ antiporter complex subunit F [unclassified Bosea (in: a-proteobacteria)]KRE08128.1 sodium:proton antiporter [Bosea sp. Root670]TQI76740.1 multisubunit sodium/proton antiporter MrpF subunit [Bosea sp. AK1]
MADFLTTAALFILAVTAIALLRVLRSRITAERMMAVQLLGTGGAAVLLLLGVASGSAAASDVALLLTLFAAFSCVAFVLGSAGQDADRTSSGEQP